MKKLFCLLLCIVCSIKGLTQQCKFYNASQGLSSSLVNAIVQDHEGFIWIATDDGLNRFDGNKFTVYRNIPNDSTSLSHNNIRHIYEDSKHRFWVTTRIGLCLYDRVTDCFHPVKVPSHNPIKEYSQFYYLHEDHNGYIWIAVSGNGVIRIDMEKQIYQYFNTTNSGICSDHMNVIYEDIFGNMWFGSGQEGLSIYNPDNGTFRTFRHIAGQTGGISSNNITSICEDANGSIWVATLTGGVNIFSAKSQSFSLLPQSTTKDCYLIRDSRQNIWVGTMGHGFEVYSADKKRVLQKINMSSVNIYDSKADPIYEDKQGNIWMGLYQKGVLMISKGNGLFSSYQHNPYALEETIGEGAVQPLFVDSHSDIWLGVDGKGLYRLDKNYTIKDHYKMDNLQSLASSIPRSIFEDSKQNLWIGTYLNGVIRLNRKANKLDFALKKGDRPFGLLSSHVVDITEDADGRLWFATNGGGVNIYNPTTEQMEYLVRDDFRKDTNQLLDNWCNQVYIDRDSLFWIATYRGLCAYDRTDGQFAEYTVKNNKLPNDQVLSLYEDTPGNIWVGTQDGLVCIPKNRTDIRKFHLSDGLPNTVINNIAGDSTGNIWLTTNNGLSMYNPEKQTFTNYTTADGLLTNEFMRNAITRRKEGEFLVGSMNGVVAFDPKQVNTFNSEPLSLAFTNLYIFNEVVTVGSSSINVLTQAVNHTEKIHFTHKQNSFSIEVSALEYQYPEKVHYEAKLEGFDQQWRTVNNRMVNYTNLNPGQYILHVRAWNKNKEQAVTRELTLQILPPFWATLWAKGLYLILFWIAGYLVYRYKRDRERVKAQERMMQMKLQFFTDISHEIRNPLTLILSPLSKLISKNTDASLMQTYNIMYKNGVRLLQLVNQIMDLRSLEFGKKKLCTEKQNITLFVRELKNSFNILAEEKNIDYQFQSDPEEIIGFIDPDIFAKIILNILSNAFKYTKTGYIKVSIRSKDNGMLELSVEDTGKGIPAEQQEQIFERFYMIDSSLTHTSDSSGIGLHLVKKLIDLHLGTIRLQSEVGKGSCFVVEIPCQQKQNAASERIAGNQSAISEEIKHYLQTEHSLTDEKVKGAVHAKHTLLLVEDNPDIRRMLLAEFSPVYHILEATNGKEGLLLAIEKEPSLIISDIVMPEMDGLTFCRNIRNHGKTHRIPFIILTARSSVQQQIEGLELGADAYIAKPFDINFLRVTINRLIDSHANVDERQVIKASMSQKEPESARVSQNDKFLKQLTEVIHRHLDNSELSVDTLCKELGLSRTHLNRRMKELTGESPASYIRQLRLHKSARLLKTHDLTIAEIAFTVGFSSPSYFSQAFRDYYGVTPKEYAELDE